MNMIKVLWCWFQQCFGRFPCCLSKGSLKRDFLDIYLTTYSDSIISEIQKLRGLPFFHNGQNLVEISKMQQKLATKFFCFWENCVWIGIVKLSLLSTGYFSSAPNVLRSSPKIRDVKSIELENSLLVTCKVLGLLVNTLAADQKYPVLNRDNLMIPIQMQISMKQRTFPLFLTAFLKSSLNCKYFETKNEGHRFCISEFTDFENVVG